MHPVGLPDVSNAVIDCYSLGVDSDSARSLLLKVCEWWTLDSTLNGSIYGAATALTLSGAAPVYAAGAKGQQAFFQDYVSRQIPGGFNGNQSHGYAFLYDLRGGGTNVATSYNSRVGVKPVAFGFATARSLIGSFLDGYELRSGLIGTPDVTITTTNPTRNAPIFCAINVTNPGASASEQFFYNAASQGTASTSSYTDSGDIFAGNSGATTVCIDGISQMFAITGNFTQAELTYLYNDGLFKSYSEVVADSLL